jgi:hypothetical protein
LTGCVSRRKWITVKEVDNSDRESNTGKIKEAKADVIEDCSSASLEGALDKMVEHGSVLTTDGWRGCVSAAHNHLHDAADGNNGENFQLEELASWNTSWKHGSVWTASPIVQ